MKFIEVLLADESEALLHIDNISGIQKSMDDKNKIYIHMINGRTFHVNETYFDFMRRLDGYDSQ